MTIGGGGGDTWTNNSHKEETSRKISEHNKGKHNNPEVIQNWIEAARKANTIEINSIELKQDIQNFISVEDICRKYNISRRTFYNKCKEFFDATPTEIRGDRLTHSNTMKINLDKEQLHQLLLQEKSLEEMANFFDVSKETVRKNIIQYYGKNLKDVRKDVKQQK